MLNRLQLKAEEERKKRLMKLESKYTDSKPGSSTSLVSSPSLEGEEARKSLQVSNSFPQLVIIHLFNLLFPNSRTTAIFNGAVA